MTKGELEALLRTLDIWVIVFGILVAIGVTGEAIVGFLHFRKGNQLHRLEVAENLAQQAEIERMKKESGLISERTANAERQAAQAGEGTAKALANAAAANERATKLEKEAAEARKQNLATETRLSEANLKLEQERTKRLEMEAWLTPRMMDQSPGKTEALNKFAGTHVELTFVVDAETTRAAGQIRALLSGVHWKIVKDVPVLQMQDGIEVVASFKEKAAAESLVEFLKAQQWNAHSRIVGQKTNEATVEILVGLKPNPYSPYK